MWDHGLCPAQLSGACFQDLSCVLSFSIYNIPSWFQCIDYLWSNHFGHNLTIKLGLIDVDNGFFLFKVICHPSYSSPGIWKFSIFNMQDMGLKQHPFLSVQYAIDTRWQALHWHLLPLTPVGNLHIDTLEWSGLPRTRHSFVSVYLGWVSHELKT